MAEAAVAEGMPEVYAAVFDGHGGAGTADWLTANLLKYVEKYWQGANAPEKAITEAFIQADKVGRRVGPPQGKRPPRARQAAEGSEAPS